MHTMVRQGSLRLAPLALALCFAQFFAGARASAAPANALEKYVQREDSSFNWKRTERKPVKGGTLTHLELISQTWRDQFWSHHLLVFRPEKLRHPQLAFLLITGGAYNAPKDEDLERFLPIPLRGGAILALLNKVPNQPLYDGRKEDALIAYTFDQYLKTGDDSWPLLFPMVKSAVRAMDALQQFAQREWSQPIESFVVSGASKRGWTTWLTGAVDPRVKAIAPMVIDMLNMKAQLAWADQMYGQQSEEIGDYTNLNLHLRLDEPRMVELRGWVDPFSYRARYTKPKLLLLGTNDPYWVVDALRHYWDDLPGPKLIFQTPNAGHDLAGGKDAINTLASWFALIADNRPLPKLEWKLTDGSSGPVSLTVKADQAAKKIRLWTAHSKDRDFRDDEWSSQDLEIQAGSSQASAQVPTPPTGFTAFMAEVELASPSGETYRLSTQVQVTPDKVSKH
jgi:PhoPQ-activated pathogenicity-related protein